MTGMVSLVGAGPGDPELLTLKAVTRLQDADLVLYDALVSVETLRHATRAQCVLVGKRAGRHSYRQETINRTLIRAALRGKRVVRLKCGDPYVFGRGGEEALALVSAGVPFEVVPGVSSAHAAASLAGIPLTHRGLASSAVIVSGHAEDAYAPVLDALPPHAATIVVMMGLATRHAIAARLIARGWPARTPVALLLGASTPQQEAWTGTLAEVAAAQDADDVDAHTDLPGTMVIGKVVSLADRLNVAAHAVSRADAADDEAADDRTNADAARLAGGRR